MVSDKGNAASQAPLPLPGLPTSPAIPAGAKVPGDAGERDDAASGPDPWPERRGPAVCTVLGTFTVQTVLWARLDLNRPN